ncbi:hypothetical protein CK216_11505 [Mesorhizobium sp. WSM3876]|nr:hypothetical protein CK216_11505 [Mesorhizobium sp. WSM3876]
MELRLAAEILTVDAESDDTTVAATAEITSPLREAGLTKMQVGSDGNKGLIQPLAARHGYKRKMCTMEPMPTRTSEEIIEQS